MKTEIKTIQEILKDFREWTRENLDEQDIVTQEAIKGFLETFNVEE